MAEKQTTTITVPAPDPSNVQAVKHFVFNETGNIMLATTDESSVQIQQSVRDVFAEVAVFFAGMTKAISTTVDPDSKTGRHYSLYNYDALEAIIDGSGCFIHVAEEDVDYKISSWGADFSKDLVMSLLGLATGTGELAFANAVVSSIGKEGVNISGDSTKSDSEVANIFFVCEYLLGMPVVSAIVVRAQATMASQTFQLGPCFKEHTEQRTLEFHKDTYMFVTPSFIEAYSGDLDKGMSDPAFLTLTGNFQKILTRTPLILDVTTTDRIPVDAPTKLALGRTYRIGGNFFGPSSTMWTPEGQTAPVSQPAKIEILDGAGQPAKTKGGTPLIVEPTTFAWNDSLIEFSVGLQGNAQWDPSKDKDETDEFTIRITLAPKPVGKNEAKGALPKPIIAAAPRGYRFAPAED